MPPRGPGPVPHFQISSPAILGHERPRFATAVPTPPIKSQMRARVLSNKPNSARHFLKPMPLIPPILRDPESLMCWFYQHHPALMGTLTPLDS